MQIGKLPSPEFLKEQDLFEEYGGIAEAVMKGDIKALEKQLDINMQVYIQSGVFLSLEKLRHLTLRNLLKKIAITIAQKPKELQAQEYVDKPWIIPLKLPFVVLREWDSELDMEELECILANLIYMGYVKGYIASEQSVLVLAKDIDKAFPQQSEKAKV